MSTWYIEGDLNFDGCTTQQSLNKFPVLLGREDTLEFAIPSSSVSRRHASISLADSGELIIEDLQSSNGTFVNRQPITEPTPIEHGDVIHFGNVEIRILDRTHMPSTAPQGQFDSGATAVMSVLSLSEKFPTGVLELEELLSKKQIAMVFQPYVKAGKLEVCGYEILGRGTNPKLTPNPAALFQIAESVGLEVVLSTLMRETGVAAAVTHKLKGTLLLNTHPKELEDQDKLLASLNKLRSQFPKTSLMLEIHEQAMTDLNHLIELKKALAKLDMTFAFDDFGVGQSRLMEIAGAKPDMVKFDRALIDKIDTADRSRLKLLKSLKKMVSELKINTLAECVSSKGEYEVCKKIGFDLYQGYYFGKPAPPETFSE